MATKRYTTLEVVLERCHIVFHGHLLNFKVARDKRRFSADLDVSGLWFQFELTDSYEMMH